MFVMFVMFVSNVTNLDLSWEAFFCSNLINSKAPKMSFYSNQSGIKHKKSAIKYTL